jgi:DNA polymerase-1
MAVKNRQSRLPGLEAEDPAQRKKVALETTAPPETVAHMVAAPKVAAPAVASNGPAATSPTRPSESGTADPRIGLPECLAGKTVYIVDSMSLIFQVFHALPEMTGPRGEPVAAVFGFTRDMLAIINQRKPDYLFCAYDLSGPTFRNELFEEYKAHRKEMPPDLSPQIESIRRVLEVLKIPVLSAPGYEADDVLATVAHLVNERGGECVIITADKDCRQLLTERVKILNLRKNIFFDVQALADDWGIRPEQVVDYQALVGDPVDNVPGVPLIGPKLARELLTKFGSLDTLYLHLDEVAGEKRRHNLLLGHEQALLSRKLVRLDTNTPVAINWSAGQPGNFDPAHAAELFAEFGFHTLTREMRTRVAGNIAEKSAGDIAIQTAAQATSQNVSRPAVAAPPLNYQTIDTPERLRWLVDEMSRQPAISFDTETTSISPRQAEIVGYSFSWRDGEAYYVPVRGPAGSQLLDPQTTLEALRPVLENPKIGKLGQNLKYDIIVLRAAGITVAGAAFDTMVASYLLDAGERNHNLDELAARYLQHETTKISSLIGAGKNQKRMDEVPIPLITHYAAEDADIAWRLRPLLAARFAGTDLQKLFDEVEVPLIEVLSELEYNGIRIDVDRLKEMSQQYGTRLAEIEQQIYELAGHKFNIGSPKQLQTVLFEEQKLPKLRRTKTGASTDADVLEELARTHPLPARISEHRQFSKLKNTYVDALPQLIFSKTGRVHASFNQSVAATGRLSSSDPNLQNIPIRTREGREIRSAFLPGHEGWQLLAADYSQIELRVLAHLSGDATMRAAFDRDEDIHARVASQVYGVELGAVTSEMRRVAKAVNFGVIYGQSPFGLAKMLDIDQQQAAEFIRAYFAGYPGVSRFLEEILGECLKNGYVSTILGRRRAIQGVRAMGATGHHADMSLGGAMAGSDEKLADVETPEATAAELDTELAAIKGAGSAPKGGKPARRTGSENLTQPIPVPQRNLAERTAINTVIQGSAADLIKLAMIAIHRRLRTEARAARMLLQIHDELIFEVPAEELEATVRLVREEMSGVMQLSVPLNVDIKTGSNWADCEPWE